jgi:hypothetical protein
MEALETKGGFRDVLDIQEQTGDEGLLQAIIEGVYVPPARAAGAEPQGASR